MKKQISLNLAWGLVVLGGIIECFWVSGLKYANTLPLYILTGVGICISFTCAVIAMKKIEVSIAYSVFVGIGTAGVVLVEMFYFKENFSLFKIILILTLLSGVIGLKLISKENKD
ncbi:multidrug efflux SMR transporter [Campylobacter sp. TTU-622]|uniref:DMT family transporter n=1 Tax=unclassified Campylobacter TaxID=2593542 RepID=UPI0019074D52|nr:MULTISPECIES: multidrug efflux SMR transporter [unclassified Campylobacter]MBK1972853.1 multidrug efflux SMR transporter [Campylobacter sp. TTU-622]MBK1991474.1 multidrug efflux SMR transporter [Campylobacter sp. 2018MI34]